MKNVDNVNVEKLLLQLEEENWLFPEFKLSSDGGGLVCLGKGGFSTIYEMYDVSRPDYKYALKVIGFEQHSVTSKRFWDSVSLQHELGKITDNVVTIIDAREIRLELSDEFELRSARDSDGTERWEEEDNIYHLQFVLMEKLQPILTKDKFNKVFLSKKDLEDEKEVYKLARNVGDVLFQAHYNNVIHRDIKLENIFWSAREEYYKLGDFGIAKFTEGGNAETVLYTDGYGAPEIERRLSDNYDATADIYSFGISLYLLLNELKFPGSDGYHVNMVQYDPEFVFPAPINASEKMANLVRWMCCYDSKDRYQSIEEVMIDLNYVEGIIPETEEEIVDDEETVYYEDAIKGEEQVDKERNETENDDADKSGEERLSRAERKSKEKALAEDYGLECCFYLAWFSLLFTVIIHAFQSNIEIANDWRFWIFAPAIVIELVLLKLKEGNVIWGAAILLYTIYYVFSGGISFLPVFMAVLVITGLPVLIASGLISTGLWLITTFTGKLSALDLVGESDLGWVFLTIIFILLYYFFDIRVIYGMASEERAMFSEYWYDKILLSMGIVGLIAWSIQHFSGISFPDTLNALHLGRVGIISFITCKYLDWYNVYI